MTELLQSLLARIPRKILTPRLEITLLTMDDCDAISDEVTGNSWDDLHHWVAWADKRENLTRIAHRANILRNMQRFENGLAYFGVSRLRETQELGPQVTLYNMNQDQKKGECGYWTPKNVTGKGLTQEGMTAILRLGYEHYGLTEIFANHSEGNLPSGRVLTKLGFAFTHIEPNGASRGNGEKINALWYRHHDPASLPPLHIEYL